MGKRPRGYIGKKTFLGRMEILEQNIPVEDPRHPEYDLKSFEELENFEEDIEEDFSRPTSANEVFFNRKGS